MTLAVRAPNWLGDAVMALPLLTAISRQTDVAVVSKPAFAAVFAGLRVIETSGRFDAHALRAAKADRILLLTNSFSTAWAARAAEIPERIGYAMHFRSPLLTTAVPLPDGKPHQIEKYLHLAAAAGYAVEETAPRLSAGPSPINGDYIVLAPGAKYGSAKRWTGFADLARLLAHSGREVAVVGLAGEGVAGVRHMRLTDFSGRTNLAEAMAVIGGASCVITNDSGLAHVAAALGRRTIVIFGPTDAAATAPRGAEVIQGRAECAPCHLRVCPIDHRCMRSVTVAEVVGRL